MSKTISF